MSTLQQMPIPPHVQADQAIREILTTQWRQELALIVLSPPGGGKTGVVERVAIQELVFLHGRAMIATLTNEQAYDLARRLTKHYPHSPIHLFVRPRLPLPQDVTSISNLVIVCEATALPKGPCIIIANAARWSWGNDTGNHHFTCLILDEAYQLPHYRFQQIASMADRLVLVGDPGQIAPVITCEIDRWRGESAGPHVPCPEALLTQHPHIKMIGLPVSRRLVADTVAMIQPIFYPTLPFVALSLPGGRRMIALHGGTTTLDQAIDLAVQGASMVQMELPPLITGRCDEELAAVIVSLIEVLFARGVQIRDENGATMPLSPSMIGVVCAHVAQVSAVVKRLPVQSGILVETADRFQGLERQIMIVYHPLSGQLNMDEFHLDAGRFCVMLSRHRIACFLVTRGGIEIVLEQQQPQGNRILGRDEDHEYISWKAHLQVQQALHQRVVRI